MGANDDQIYKLYKTSYLKKVYYEDLSFEHTHCVCDEFPSNTDTPKYAKQRPSIVQQLLSKQMLKYNE